MKELDIKDLHNCSIVLMKKKLELGEKTLRVFFYEDDITYKVHYACSFQYRKDLKKALLEYEDDEY